MQGTLACRVAKMNIYTWNENQQLKEWKRLGWGVGGPKLPPFQLISWCLISFKGCVCVCVCVCVGNLGLWKLSLSKRLDEKKATLSVASPLFGEMLVSDLPPLTSAIASSRYWACIPTWYRGMSVWGSREYTMCLCSELDPSGFDPSSPSLWNSHSPPRQAFKGRFGLILSLGLHSGSQLLF